MPDRDAIPKPMSTSRRVWQLAWPTIISNLLFTTVGFTHIRIVSELGTSSVAAVTTGHRVFFLVQAMLMGVSIAATALISRSWGAGDPERGAMVAWTSMAMSLAVAAVLSIPVLLVPEAIAALFGLDDATTALAASFIFWLGVFNIFSAINMMLSTALRATGNVITPLWFLLASSITNVTFAYLLAFGIGPLPAMGVAGVGLGGGAAGAIISCIFAVIWWRGKFKLKAVKRLTFDGRIARQLFTIGAPSVVEQGLVQLAFLAFFAIVARYGTEPFAAYGIGISIVAFSIVVGFGFGLAAATLVGQQLGAGNRELAVQAGWRSLRMAMISMVILSALLAWFANDLARFMIRDTVVIELTTAFIYMIAASQPLMAFEFALGGALRGAGDTRFPLFATFCGLLFGRLLPSLILLYFGMPVLWIYAVMLLDYGIKATLIVHRYRSLKWLDAHP